MAMHWEQSNLFFLRPLTIKILYSSNAVQYSHPIAKLFSLAPNRNAPGCSLKGIGWNRDVAATELTAVIITRTGNNYSYLHTEGGGSCITSMGAVTPQQRHRGHAQEQKWAPLGSEGTKGAGNTESIALALENK